MDDSNKDDHAKTLPKEHDRDAAIDDARKAPEELEDEGLDAVSAGSGEWSRFGPGIPPKPYPSVTTALCNLAPLVIRHFQTSGRSRTHTSPHQSSTIKDTL